MIAQRNLSARSIYALKHLRCVCVCLYSYSIIILMVLLPCHQHQKHNHNSRSLLAPCSVIVISPSTGIARIWYQIACIIYMIRIHILMSEQMLFDLEHLNYLLSYSYYVKTWTKNIIIRYRYSLYEDNIIWNHEIHTCIVYLQWKMKENILYKMC